MATNRTAKPQAPHQLTTVTGLLGQLVAHPTVTGDHAASRAAIDWIKQQLAHLPLHLTEVTHDGFPAIVFTTRRTQHPKVLLLAHLDVVPGPPELFELRQRQGRLYGRGVFDMKLALAAHIRLLQALGDDLSRYDLGLMVTTDEEFGGSHGVAPLVEAGWRADVVINPDAGSGQTAWELETAAKGFGSLQVESFGRTGHASQPWAHKNALNQLMAFIQELRGHFAAEPCGDAAHRHNTMAVTIMQGGDALNQIPGHAAATLDLRILPTPDAIQDLERTIATVASHYTGIQTSWPIRPHVFVLDPDNEYLRLAELIITKVTGVVPKHILSHGGTDSRYFGAHGIPSILTRPKGGSAHADNEWVDAKGPEQLYRIIHEFVVQVARQP